MRATCLFASLLGGALASSRSHSLPPSSPRKSLNFGPSILTRSAIQSSSSFLTHRPAGRADSGAAPASPTEFGQAIASMLISDLHPKAHFQVTSSYVSSHSGVSHTYFVQIVPLGGEAGVAKVSNAVASVHVDVNPQSERFGMVLGYDESFHGVEEGEEVEEEQFGRLTNRLHLNELAETRSQQIKEWSVSCEASRADEQAFADSSPGQQVLNSGGASSSVSCDVLPQHLEGPLDASPASAVVDPRVALVSFLTLAGSPSTASKLSSQSLDELVNSMWIRHPFRASGNDPVHRVEVMGAPGAATADEGQVATKAELAFLSVEGKGDKGKGNRFLQLTWRFEYRSEANWYEGYVDATRPGEVVQAVDWVRDFRPTTDTVEVLEAHIEKLEALRASLADLPESFTKSKSSNSGQIGSRNATYRVWPWSVNDPSEGDRELLVNPHHPFSSRNGWHEIPVSQKREGSPREGLDDDWVNQPGWSSKTRYGMNTTDTRGNNVFAQENWEGLSRWENNGRPDGTLNLTFDFKLHWGHKNWTGRPVDPKKYIDASVTELFFTCNEIHDLFYLYGFDEVAGNFQEYNFGRGGKEGDAVIANAQDGSGYNNANFATPPDGSHGQMRMYVWNGAEPWRDGDLEAGIVIHEYAHGISTRLTGGPANSGCLGWGEAGGMGEGWGDAFATLIRMHKKKPRDFTMGEWASGMKDGIRKYKYSLNHTISPETYKTLDKPGYWGVHAIGEVWAEMLYTVAEALIQKHGFEHSLFPPVNASDSDFFTTTNGNVHPRRGNTLFLQLVVDGMKFQPCRPTFMDARDALIQADVVLTGGNNTCEIWDAFASRGLGPEAVLKGATPWGGGIRDEDYTVPRMCMK